MCYDVRTLACKFFDKCFCGVLRTPKNRYSIVFFRIPQIEVFVYLDIYQSYHISFPWSNSLPKSFPFRKLGYICILYVYEIH